MDAQRLRETQLLAVQEGEQMVMQLLAVDVLVHLRLERTPQDCARVRPQRARIRRQAQFALIHLHHRPVVLDILALDGNVGASVPEGVFEPIPGFNLWHAGM